MNTTSNLPAILASRRRFLGQAGAMGILALGAQAPGFWARAAQGAVNRDGRILVLLQLAGGNDGLNTVIPHTRDEYYRLRPSLAVPKGAALKLNDELSLNPQLVGLKELHDQGLLSIIQGVGYPAPNRSHFRSMDIWHSAVPTKEHTRDGWLGRAMDAAANSLVGQVPALALETGPLPLALVAGRTSVPTIQGVQDYRLSGGAGDALEQQRKRSLIGSLANHRGTGANDADDDLAFLRRTATTAIATAKRIEASASHKPTKPYPATGLGRRLETIARFIAADVGPQVYFVSLDGFDTHSDQAQAHNALLTELGGATRAFFRDLEASGLAKRVLLATFSEFGRRVKENGSLGTDHGAASQMFLMSGGIAPTIHGSHPSLTDLDEGDLKHHTDFRQVYATLLEQWLGWPSEPALLGRFKQLKLG